MSTSILGRFENRRELENLGWESSVSLVGALRSTLWVWPHAGGANQICLSSRRASSMVTEAIEHAHQSLRIIQLYQGAVPQRI